MSWVRLDDRVQHHPKILKAGPMAAWLWVCSIGYCSSQLTDGEIPDQALPTFGLRNILKLASTLVNTGLWERTPTGYRVHDYLAFNPTADQIRQKRQATADKVRDWREKRDCNRVTRSEAAPLCNRVSNPAPTPVPTPEDTPQSPPRGAIPMRPSAARRRAEEIRVKAWGRCQHDDPCESYEACILRLTDELRAGPSEAYEVAR
jgi:hypothetical protein